MDYPEEWNELPKQERKKKIKELKKQSEQKSKTTRKTVQVVLIVLLLILAVLGWRFATQKSPEEIAFEQEVGQASLDGRVEEFPIEGVRHVTQRGVAYDTNPPTSGDHLAQPAQWGVYDEELIDEAVVHSLEHGGIWISYTDISDEDLAILEQIGRNNPGSVIVSPRSQNDALIAVVSWGRRMQLDAADEVLIQKYINTFINQSPERLAQ